MPVLVRRPERHNVARQCEQVCGVTRARHLRLRHGALRALPCVFRAPPCRRGPLGAVLPAPRLRVSWSMGRTKGLELVTSVPGWPCLRLSRTE